MQVIPAYLIGVTGFRMFGICNSFDDLQLSISTIAINFKSDSLITKAIQISHLFSQFSFYLFKYFVMINKLIFDKPTYSYLTDMAEARFEYLTSTLRCSLMSSDGKFESMLTLSIISI